jgi:retinol-binding protein 3
MIASIQDRPFEQENRMEPEPMIVDAATLSEIVRSLSENLRAYYVFPGIAEQVCIRLEKGLEAGEYTQVTEGEILALALTIHMQEVTHDEHLWVRWHPDPLPEQDSQLRNNPAWMEERLAEAKLDNYGLHKVERLPGNVGYLDIRYFHRPAWGGDTAVAAMNFLANTQALIIDLRQCEGGYPGMTALFCSYLFGEEPVHLDSIYWRDEDVTQQYWTLACVPGQRFGNKPVYALISKSTFSAGEQFAYVLQAQQRAILVGERTDGGAHPGACYRIHPNFEAFIPVGRSINPVTGTDWEGCGVAPDVPVAREQTLDVAYRMALEAILARLDEAPAGTFKALAEEVKTALRKVPNFDDSRQVKPTVRRLNPENG